MKGATEFTELANDIITTSKKNKIDLFGKGITHIKKLTKHEESMYSNVSEIDLSHNVLKCINNLKNIPLKVLNVAHNKLSD
jgi:hypothetical protein